MKKHIENLINEALGSLADMLPENHAPVSAEVERTRDSKHGDFATNVAMRLAKAAKTNPREFAQRAIEAMPVSDLVEDVQIAGPGFINFRLAPAAYHAEVRRVLDAGGAYGRSDAGAGQSVLVEFISANPTGPLHVGHGRHAAYGATVANLLEAVGHRVHREYYVNDAGRQMNILALSVWLRYLEALGENVPFPRSGYRGAYIAGIAAELVAVHGENLKCAAADVSGDLPPDGDGKAGDAHVDALIERAGKLLGDKRMKAVLDRALDDILADIEQDLKEFGVVPDEWFSERGLAAQGAIDHALDKLEERGTVYRKDGALWFRATDYGDEKDRVVVRENGQKTYFASDIAYHLFKRERGYDILLDVLGADHHGYVSRVRGGLEAMGEPGNSLEVRLVQFVALYRGGAKVPMSTRSGDFVTLRELRSEVGNDAARFFYVMRSNDQHLDFDLELATSRSEANPVYYIQYAHARVASLHRKFEEKGYEYSGDAGRGNLGLLTEKQEKELMRSVSRYPEAVELAAANRAPHHLVHYLRDLANDFHTCYNALKVIVDDAAVRNARMTLSLAVQQVIRNGLGLLGVSAPDSM